MAPITKKAASKQPPNPENLPIDPDVETWRNVTAGTVYVARIGEYGRKASEVVLGGRTFAITPQERRMNQNACAVPDLDIFSNGTLEPVTLIDEEPDTERLRNNPNTLSERDMRLLFRQRGEAFERRVAAITNAAAIARLIAAARDPQHEATLAQYEALKRRKLEIDDAVETEAPEPADPNTAGLPRGVTPS